MHLSYERKKESDISSLATIYMSYGWELLKYIVLYDSQYESSFCLGMLLARTQARTSHLYTAHGVVVCYYSWFFP